MNISPGWILPGSLKQLDNNKDEKMNLFRVVMMKHKIEEFVTIARKEYRVLVKEFSMDEIENLPKEDEEKKKIKANIDSYRKDYYTNLTSAFEELYFAYLHLKVAI